MCGTAVARSNWLLRGLVKPTGSTPVPILRALWRREQIGSTAIGQGVAIPHAAHCRHRAAADAVHASPRFAMDFDAPDGKLVSPAILVIMARPDGARRRPPAAARRWSRKPFSDPAFRSSLFRPPSTTRRKLRPVFAQWADQPPGVMLRARHSCGDAVGDTIGCA